MPPEALDAEPGSPDGRPAASGTADSRPGAVAFPSESAITAGNPARSSDNAVQSVDAGSAFGTACRGCPRDVQPTIGKNMQTASPACWLARRIDARVRGLTRRRVVDSGNGMGRSFKGDALRNMVRRPPKVAFGSGAA